MVVAKFWLHVAADEQQRRFEARAQTPYKKYKLTAEDWRNRAKRAAYEAAVDEMVARTSTGGAPWHLVAANDKRHARVVVLETTCDALARALKRS
jgi:polyphosphate kinase 2 (PPK2 family)